MTAVPDWDIVEPRTTDAELVHASMAGDRVAFGQIYDRYADRLHDFCVGMLRDLDTAADCVQETFCVAATRLHQLRDPDRLRPWLYSIARNEALRRLRELRRETPSDELPDVEADDPTPETLSARAELADLIAEAAGGLSDRDRAVLDLSYRHGLDGPDLAEALGVSHGNANTMVVRLRKTVERSLGALLIARRAQRNADACADLRRILEQWDGQFTVLMRKRVSRHIESCAVCDEERRRLVSPTALLGAAPVLIPAPQWLRDRTVHDVQLTSHGSPLVGDEQSAREAVAVGDGHRRRRNVLVAALATLLGAAVFVLAQDSQSPATVGPVEVSDAAPEPADPPPPAVQPPPTPTAPPATPRSAPPPTPTPPPTLEASTPVAPPAEPAPAADQPAEEPAPPVEQAPKTKPPMSFAPTVTVAPAAPPELGGGDDGGRRSPVGAAP